MKKVIAILSILVTLTATVAYTTLAVNAHPGRTDSNGGHTDHSTGEYHYHHGYSAHDHYDMDGDGDLDCPYDFDDKTSHSSTGSVTVEPNTTPAPEVVLTPSDESVSVHKKEHSLKWIRPILMVLMFPLVILALWLGFRLSVWIGMGMQRLFNLSDDTETIICLMFAIVILPALVFVVIWGVSSV